MPWPQYGQAAYGVPMNNVVTVSSDSAKPVPMASLTKVITALAILKQKPIEQGEQGPMITLSQQDVEIFSDYVRKNGAVVAVEAGEQISEYQALQAMLMPSANNMAESLAIWAFGSNSSYVAYANNMLKEAGITDTTIADASGFSKHSVSTAADLVKIGNIYLQNDLLRGIAQQNEAKVPVAGLIKNYNSLVNKDGVIGIKVGNTDEAGRCFLVADIRKISNGETVSIAAVLGAPNLQTAMHDGVAILNAGDSGYDQLTSR